jgi:hypothetical protein
MLNPATMDRYTWPTGTIGGSIAVRDLVDKTNWMRSFRGSRVYPAVTLSDTFMRTRFGGRQRPHLIIKRWISLGPKEPVLPAPATDKALEKPAAETTTGVRTVEAPSLSEELNDEIPSNGGVSKKGRTGKAALMPPV